MEVRTWHICQKSKAAIDKRFRVMAKPGGRLSHPPSVKHNDTGRGGGCQCSRWEGEEREEAVEHGDEIKDGQFKKLVKKEGINEKHRHKGAIMASVEVSKIFEISHLIASDPVLRHGGVSPSSHYWLYCANESIWHSLVLTLPISMFYYLSRADVGHKMQQQNHIQYSCNWKQTLLKKNTFGGKVSASASK